MKQSLDAGYRKLVGAIIDKKPVILTPILNELNKFHFCLVFVANISLGIGLRVFKVN